jgi:hypothetical protein
MKIAFPSSDPSRPPLPLKRKTAPEMVPPADGPIDNAAFRVV